jgi:glycerol-3-phosphate dehydrogenase (NAD(P)+)
MGLGVAESVRRMQGATLECLEILAVLRRALAHFEVQGILQSDEVPLLHHMMAVALDDEPVNMPFSEFRAVSHVR